MTDQTPNDVPWHVTAGVDSDPVELARLAGVPVEVTTSAPQRGMGGTLGTLTRHLADTLHNLASVEREIGNLFRRD